MAAAVPTYTPRAEPNRPQLPVNAVRWLLFTYCRHPRRASIWTDGGLAGWLLVVLPLEGCVAAATAPVESPRYVYYLHGKIIEDFGPAGVSPRYGAYDYAGILHAFEHAGLTVVSEVRPKDTNPSTYANKVVGEIRRKLALGVPAENITVIGASKGSVIAMLASSRLRVSKIRYVFLANCNDWMERTYAPRFTGDVLSIYEASDVIGQSCRDLARQ